MPYFSPVLLLLLFHSFSRTSELQIAIPGFKIECTATAQESEFRFSQYIYIAIGKGLISNSISLSPQTWEESFSTEAGSFMTTLEGVSGVITSILHNVEKNLYFIEAWRLLLMLSGRSNFDKTLPFSKGCCYQTLAARRH